MTSILLKNKLVHFRNKLISSSKKHNNLPATIIGAEYLGKQEVESSGPVPAPISRKLKIELEKIGPLGTRGKDNIIGCCSEVRSSNNLIENIPYVGIRQIEFTKAIRPRTGQVVKRCKNCKEVFG